MADIYSILAGKGRGQDEYIRNVSGRPSHVNEVEKDAIDIYGLLGEIFTKNVGSGDINPNTGLTEYDWKENIWGNRKKSSGSPHNASHDKFVQTGGQQGKDPKSHKTGAELTIEQNQADTLATGEELLDPTSEENIDPETGLPKTAGQLNLGQTVLKAEDYKNMTPEDIVNDIFAKQYNNQVPPDMGMSESEFKAHLAAQLDKMPQFGEADETKMGFLGEAKDIAVEKASITAQSGAQQIGGVMRGAYGGMGAGMRAGVGSKLGQTYGLGLKTADLGYREGKYGLEQQAGADWETGFQSFLAGLPEPA